MDASTFTDGVVALVKNADLQVILAVTILTFLVRRTFWTMTHAPVSWLCWFSILAAFPLTALLGASDEVRWGGQYFAKAAINNGLAAVVVWLLFVPAILQKWPQLMKDEPTGGPSEEGAANEAKKV